MKELYYEKWLRWLPLLAGSMVFLLFVSLQRQFHPERVVLRTFRELTGLLKKQKQAVGWYQKTQAWLTKNGACFHYGRRMEPMRYLAVRILLGTAGMAAMLTVSVFAGLCAGAALFFLPDVLLLYLNGRDNERLLPELKLIYHALEIQIRAGVYVMDALTECCGSAQSARLRAALMRLAGDVAVKADAYQALERFQAGFDNRYIDSLCMIILQALESGQALELLGDIGEQIKDMEETVLARRKGALDRSVTFYQLGILSAVLGVAVYACVTHMFGAAAGF